MIDSLEGETDIDGDGVSMGRYAPYGTPFGIDVFLDVSAADVDCAAADSPQLGQSTIVLSSSLLTARG